VTARCSSWILRPGSSTLNRYGLEIAVPVAAPGPDRDRGELEQAQGRHAAPRWLNDRRVLHFRSISATVGSMPVIPQKELRNNVADVLRRAEAGEHFTITVAGRPVAQLGPAARRQWVSGPQLAKVWETPAPQTLAEDLEQFSGELSDPFG
jgi:prevent-host-death family protein